MTDSDSTTSQPDTTPDFPLTTPLTDWHLAHGGKLVDFAGYNMPIQYQGITQEHHAVRRSCGLFDIGHMARLRLQGSAVVDCLEALCTRRIHDMAIGQVRYSLFCADDGGVIDDILISREATEQFHLVVNASNHVVVLAELTEAAATYDALTVTDLTRQQAMLAVQGPDAQSELAKLEIIAPELRYYRFTELEWRGFPLRLSRTGYTGEDGFECFSSPQGIIALWESLVAAGVMACGLGARDTLRLEAGMPLYGHELDRDHNPLAAGLDFAVDLEKPFRGREAMIAEGDKPLRQVLVGLKGSGKRPPRAGYPVLDDTRHVIGEITSGTLSPTLGYPIAMAWIEDSCVRARSELVVDIRGRSTEPVEVVDLPFYKKSK